MLILFCMLDFIPEYNNNHACFVTSDSILLRFMSFLLPSSLKYRELPILNIFLEELVRDRRQEYFSPSFLVVVVVVAL